eukprot:scaffold27860_cov27-Cyclotella_meneghiniana.AAC.2
MKLALISALAGSAAAFAPAATRSASTSLNAFSIDTMPEAQRAQKGWVDPADASFDQPGLLKDNYYPGDIGFDPLGLKPEDPAEFDLMVTKELQNGRLAMLAAAGFLAQEAVDGKGILEHFSS